MTELFVVPSPVYARTLWNYLKDETKYETFVVSPFDYATMSSAPSSDSMNPVYSYTALARRLEEKASSCSSVYVCYPNSIVGNWISLTIKQHLETVVRKPIRFVRPYALLNEYIDDEVSAKISTDPDLESRAKTYERFAVLDRTFRSSITLFKKRYGLPVNQLNSIGFQEVVLLGMIDEFGREDVENSLKTVDIDVLKYSYSGLIHSESGLEYPYELHNKLEQLFELGWITYPDEQMPEYEKISDEWQRKNCSKSRKWDKYSKDYRCVYAVDLMADVLKLPKHLRSLWLSVVKYNTDDGVLYKKPVLRADSLNVCQEFGSDLYAITLRNLKESGLIYGKTYLKPSESGLLLLQQFRVTSKGFWSELNSSALKGSAGVKNSVSFLVDESRNDVLCSVCSSKQTAIIDNFSVRVSCSCGLGQPVCSQRQASLVPLTDTPVKEAYWCQSCNQVRIFSTSFNGGIIGKRCTVCNTNKKV